LFKYCPVSILVWVKIKIWEIQITDNLSSCDRV
jgi:hypothetical protein